MKLSTFLVLTILFISQYANAQTQLTEIWLVDISMTDGIPSTGAPLRITENDYYDNQPCFSRDGGLLWYASMPDTTQSDIYEYNVKKKLFRQVTNSIESEFQPQPIPGERYKLSIVRVDEDKGQRFYSIAMDGTDPEQIMQNQDSVAYYTWMNDTTLGAYFLNGAEGVLHQYDMKVQQSIILAEGGFGRCLARIPGTDNLSYIQKSLDGTYLLMSFKMSNEERNPIVVMLPGVEDYCWGPDGKIYAGDKSKLYYLDTTLEAPKWIQIADFTKTVGTFYRLAMSPKGDKLAMVSYRGERP